MAEQIPRAFGVGSAPKPQARGRRLKPTLVPKPEPQLIPACVRQEMIAEAAYFRAEARGFIPGHEVDAWLAAEAEIEELVIRRYG